MELTKEFRDRFVKRLQGREFILYGGLLELARQKGMKKLEVEIVQIPSKENGHYAVCSATLIGEDGSVYREVGDASPENVNKSIAPHILRMAATRAKARALRDFTGVDMVALEELGSADETSYDDAAEEEHICSACGESITQAVYAYSMRKFGKPLCMNCQKEAVNQ